MKASLLGSIEFISSSIDEYVTVNQSESQGVGTGDTK